MTRFEWDQLDKQRSTFFKFYRWGLGMGALVCCMCCTLTSVGEQSRPVCHQPDLASGHAANCCAPALLSRMHSLCWHLYWASKESASPRHDTPCWASDQPITPCPCIKHQQFLIAYASILESSILSLLQ